MLHIPPARYLGLDGEGSPGSRRFLGAIEAISVVACTIRFALKKNGRPDCEGPPLEGIWTRGGGAQWRWKFLVRVPDSVTTSVVELAKHTTRAGGADEAISKIELLRIEEGRSVQVLHKGPWGEAEEALLKLEALMANQQLSPNGPRHEIYLSDPRWTKPEKLLTILRQPVATAGAEDLAW